jgi:hypothetical protein
MAGSHEPSAAELEAAFRVEATLVMPGVEWLAEPDGSGVVFPSESKTLGALAVSWTSGEYTVFCGRRGFHVHFMPTSEPGDDRSAAMRLAAREALEFSHRLVRDEIVLRWGLGISSCYSRTRRGSPWRRAWRAVTPWVSEAVWSRKLTRRD